MHSLLFQNHDLNVRLCYYQVEEQMKPHYHDTHQISFLLNGNMLERNANVEKEIIVPSIGFKPAGFIHANEYGDLGSLILSINIHSDYQLESLPVDLSGWKWRAQHSKVLLAQVNKILSLLSDDSIEDKESLAWELVTLVDAPINKKTRNPPGWLDEIRQQLHDENNHSLTYLAETQGVHPAYLSRIFSQYFYCSPVLYRARARFSNALVAIQSGSSLAEAAYEAGYSDQAHLSRQAKNLSGLAPGRIQQLLFQAA